MSLNAGFESLGMGHGGIGGFDYGMLCTRVCCYGYVMLWFTCYLEIYLVVDTFRRLWFFYIFLFLGGLLRGQRLHTRHFSSLRRLLPHFSPLESTVVHFTWWVLHIPLVWRQLPFMPFPGPPQWCVLVIFRDWLLKVWCSDFLCWCLRRVFCCAGDCACGSWFE